MRPTLIAAATLLASPFPAMAQLSGAIDVGSGIGRVQSGTWVRESRLAPSVRLNHRFGFLHTDAALLERGGTMQLDRAAYDAAIASPAFGPFRLAGGVTGTSDSVYSTLSLRRPEMTAALSAAYRRSGVWLGTSARSGGSPVLVAGAWRTLGAAVVSVYSTRRSSAARALEFREREVAGWDTTVTDSGPIARPVIFKYTDTLRTARLRSWSDLEARVDWSMGRLSLSATVAGRGASDSGTTQQLWGRVGSALRVADNVWLTGIVGSSPAPIGARIAPARFASIGVRLAHVARTRPPLPAAIRPSATAFAIAASTPGLYRITVRAPSARTVDVAGDFNGWRAVTLEERSPGVWEAMVSLTPGTHRLSLRVDGDRWIAPPGVPSVDDEFNGRVGVVVVK